ncbi:MAG: phosphate signaling complex protein PhoU [Thermoflexus hugenholtzii]|jgi:phosphate transport system protein|uniref:phosphate signaling complex protein PhoU n=1 Tax=Thermoflexus TaxID=1495649 RepID=UPI001C7942F7|nr:MAG: phosphate signaling complex protein PhoU [Thermoflexus hugenholtzii]
MNTRKPRVLVLCTGNAARSQMAEGLIRAALGDRVEVFSAGTHPAGYVHPMAIRVMREIGIDISGQRSKSLSEFIGQPFDLVLTVCDDAAEECPVWPGQGERMHIGYPDPGRRAWDEEGMLEEFREVRDRMREELIPALRRWLERRETEQRMLDRVPAGDYHTGARSGKEGLMQARVMLERDLSAIRQDVLRLGGMVEQAIDRCIEALKRLDVEMAREIIAFDEEINRMRYQIEEACLETIATQQPMASDLRAIIAAMFCATNLERMGDHAKSIAKLTIEMADEPLLKPLIDIPRMAQIAKEMLRQVLEAYVEQDPEKARAAVARDDEVDALDEQVYRELITYMMQDPRTIFRATRLLWISHNLERIADRVTNIAERVIFMVTGELQELN